MSNVSEILSKKGGTIWSVSLQATVYDTLQLMTDKNVGAVLVLEDGKIAGIFSERDFARHSVKKSLQLDQIPVKEMMTTRIRGVLKKLRGRFLLIRKGVHRWHIIFNWGRELF